MILVEAIKVQELRLRSPFVKANQRTVDSTKLSIEAMKELQVLRETTIWGEWKPLPGETID